MLIRYLKSEQYKIICNPWFVIAAVAIVVFIPVMAFTLGSYFGETGFILTKSKLIQGFYLGQAGFVILAGLYFGREYLRSSLRTSLLSSPVRHKLLISKFMSILIWTTGIFMLSSVIAIAALYMNSGNDLGLSELKDIAKTLSPCFISTVELVVITCAAVILSKSMIVSMSIPVALILGLGNLLLQYGRIFRYFPVVSAMNGFFVYELPNYLEISKGLAVQGIWSIALLVAGAIVFEKRCVK
ncbi:MAG: hypothetical protein J6U23_08460 [Clostridiales bacterium]|nr:hypothetical protein [Clostridiales bacterium]